MSHVLVHVIWGSDPDSGQKRSPIGVALDKDEADAVVLNGLMGTLMSHLQVLTDGGQLSVLVTRGRAPVDEEDNPPGTFASFVIDNPPADGRKGDRHAWEFQVERRSTESLPLSPMAGGPGGG